MISAFSLPAYLLSPSRSVAVQQVTRGPFCLDHLVFVWIHLKHGRRWMNWVILQLTFVDWEQSARSLYNSVILGTGSLMVDPLCHNALPDR